jgi:DnaJ-class molecular chaperone
VYAAVLKDADKKAAYDSNGHAGVDGSMGGGPQGAGGDPFAEFFRQQQSAGAGQQMNTDFFEQVLTEYTAD